MPSVSRTMRPTALRSNASRARSSERVGESFATTPTPLAQLRQPARGGLGGRATEGSAERRAHAARERFEEGVFGGVVDQLLGLDHVARHGFGAAVRVGQAQLDALFAGPDEPREELGGFLQALAAAVAHHLDELLVD